ncbi:MAG: hypothetical protein FWH54_00590 [Methanobrevibacter sp.]|nr:hypothetical protein [Methanobrevibacter sp.]
MDKEDNGLKRVRRKKRHRKNTRHRKSKRNHKKENEEIKCFWDDELVCKFPKHKEECENNNLAETDECKYFNYRHEIWFHETKNGTKLIADYTCFYRDDEKNFKQKFCCYVGNQQKCPYYVDL